MIARRLAPILFLCVSLVARAQAQEAETDAAAGKQPIEITAEGGIEWDRNAQTYTARGAAQALHVDVLVRNRLHHVRPGHEHVARAAHHVDEIGDRG